MMGKDIKRRGRVPFMVCGLVIGFAAVLLLGVFLRAVDGLSYGVAGGDGSYSGITQGGGVDFTDGFLSYDKGSNAVNDSVGGPELSAPSDGSPSSESGETLHFDGQKMIYTYDMTVETYTYDEFESWVRGRVGEYGGYIENSRSDRYGSTRRLYLTARVPASKAQDFIGDLHGNGNVVSESEDAEDVTLEYSDTEARIESLRLQQSRLMELMAQAEDLQTTLDIEDRLSDLSYEIESYERRLRTLSNLVDYSVFDIVVNEVEVYTEPEPEGFVERIVEGFKDNLSGVGVFFREAAVVFVTHIPALVTFAVFCGILAFVVKKIRKVRRNKLNLKASSVIISEEPASVESEKHEE